MTDFLLRLLQMSVAGSLVAGLLLLWKRILRKEAVHTVFYYMWLLVLLRLCVPFGVTLSLPVPGGTAMEAARQEQGNREERTDVGAGADTLQPGGAGTGPVQPPPSNDVWSATETTNAAQKTSPGLWDVILSPLLWMLVWGAGAAVCLGRCVMGYARFVRAVRKTASDASWRAWEVLRHLDPKGRTGLVVCPFAATPMLVGILRPLIVLPAGIEEERRLWDILAHELVHARRRDLLYKWFAAAVTSLHWFNPVMVLVRREIGRACELSCDAVVMRGMDEQGRRHYGDTLLCLAASSADPGIVAMTLCEEKRQLKERLVAIAAGPRKGAGAVLVSLYVAVFLGGCAMVSGARLEGEVRSDDDAGAAGEGTNQADGELGAVFSDADAPGAGEEVPSGAAADLPQESSDDDSREERERKAADLLREVLLGERSFLCINSNSGPTPMDIRDVPGVCSPGSAAAKIRQFAVLDSDGNGEEEVIVRVIDAATGDPGGCMVLYCFDGEVYGCDESYRAFENLKVDGTYDAYDVAYGAGISRLRFAGQSCTSERIAYCVDPSQGTSEGYPQFEYTVNGAQATEAEWNAVLEEQQKKADAGWYSFNDAQIRAQLAGEEGLSFVYVPDDRADLYRFPVRVSDTRVLDILLETSEPQKDYFSVDRLYVYDGDVLIQTIETSELTPSEEYLWEGLFVNRGHVEGEPDVRDVTFDGAEDFGLLCAASYSKNLPFCWFYWNEDEGRFVQGFTIFGGVTLEVDYEQKCLIEHRYEVDGERTVRYA